MSSGTAFCKTHHHFGREDLYKTWNRSIQLAEGEYITLGNVDDVRFPDSVRKRWILKTQ